MRSSISVIRHPGQLFYGWRMLALVSFIGAINNGLFVKGSALFLIPVQMALGLDRATTSLVFSLARSEGALEGPVVGYLVDRFGAKKMIVIGTILAGIGFLVFARADNVWVFGFAYLVLISLGAATGFQHAVAANVNMWFSRMRVRALAVQEASANLGSIAIIPLIGLVIAVYDWRAAAVVAAVAYLGIILPLAFFVKSSPESMGLLPDGAEPTPYPGYPPTPTDKDENKPEIERDGSDFYLKEALLSTSYWMLLLGTMFRQMAKAPVQIHIVAILHWKGLDLATASLVFAFWVGMNVPSKLMFGFLGDRWSKQGILGGGMLLYAIAVLILIYGNSLWAFLLAAFIGGLSEGITPINWGAIGDYFGRRYYATLRGTINLSHSWAFLVLPWAAGWWFDRDGHYWMTLWLSLGCTLASAVFYLLMRRPKLPARLLALQVGAGATD